MLDVIALSKRFTLTKKEQKQKNSKSMLAVNDVSLHCAAGGITGLLGCNGAGKTTTLRLLSTAMQASAGQIVWQGKNINDDLAFYRRQIGFISGNTKLYRRLTVAENMRYFGQLYQMPKTQIEQRIEELASRLQMSDFLHRKADDLSTGMYQRANLARAIVHNPQLLILDEPTTGLDVAAAEIVLQVMQQEQQAGKTVIFSTHHMHEVERLCDQIVVIHQGQRRYAGTVPNFLAQTHTERLDHALLSVIQTATSNPPSLAD